MKTQLALRGKNAASSAAAALAVLLVMSVWIGGAKDFSEIVLTLAPRFLVIIFIALVLGAFLHARRIGWSLLIGALVGLAGSVAILQGILTHI